MALTIKEKVNLLITDFKEVFDELDEVEVELKECSSYGALDEIWQCLDEFVDRIVDFKDSVEVRKETLSETEENLEEDEDDTYLEDEEDDE